MKKSRFTPEQILQALRQAEGGTVCGEICRKLGVTEATFAGGESSMPAWTWVSCGSSGRCAKRTASCGRWSPI